MINLPNQLSYTCKPSNCKQIDKSRTNVKYIVEKFPKFNHNLFPYTLSYCMQESNPA
jgi:hypothetical protein